MFHRLSVPTYAGGLPANYDYINNPSANGDPGTPAPVDSKKSSGVNQGTYLVAFGEGGASAHVNRGLNTLAENTDILDNWLRTSQVVMRSVSGTAPGPGGLTSLALTGIESYVGSPTDQPATANDQATRNRLFHVVDLNDNEIQVAGVRVQVTLVHDGSNSNRVGVPSSGFYTNATLNFSPTIPATTQYKIYYLARRSLVDILTNKPAELMMEQVRTAHRVPGELQGVLANLHGGPSPTWDGAWATTLTDLRYQSLDGVYRHSVTLPVSSPDLLRYPLYPDASPGAGGWINRDGPAVSIYSNNASVYTDPTGALFRLVENDTAQNRGTVGLLVEGSYRDGHVGTYAGESDRFAGFASFLVTDVRRGTNSQHASNPKTRIIAGSSVTLGTTNNNPLTGSSTVTLGAGQYFRQTGSGPTDIVIGYDMLRLRFTVSGITYLRDYVVVGFTGTTIVNVRQPNGSVPDFGGATGAIVVEWLRWSVGAGEAGWVRTAEENGATAGTWPNGFTVIGTGTSSPGVVSSSYTTIASRNNGNGTPVLKVQNLLPSGALNNILLVTVGDTASGNIPQVVADARLYVGGGVGAAQGVYYTAETTIALTSVSTAISTPLLNSRFFTVTCDSTVTSGQSLAVSLSEVGVDALDLAKSCKMLLVFTQQLTGAGSGTAVLTWPGTAKFESPADSQPKAGYGAVTFFEGTRLGTNWYFTKRAY